MDGQRPNFIALPPRQGTASSSTTNSPGGSNLPSPRREHVAGDVTPAMSPLDSLAAHSRAMARQLGERRVSRLPPLTMAEGYKSQGNSRTQSPQSQSPQTQSAGKSPWQSNPQLNTPPQWPQSAQASGPTPWGQSHAPSPGARPPRSAGGVSRFVEEGFASRSNTGGPSRGDTGSSGYSGGFSPPGEQSGIKLAIESPTSRPRSYYPRLSHIPPRAEHGPTERDGERFLTPQEHSVPDYFGAPRTHSPERSAPTRPSMESTSHKSSYSSLSKSKTSFESHRNVGPVRGMSTESNSSRFSQYSAQPQLQPQLQPPNPPYARKTPSIRSVSSDDENPGITPSSSYSQHRKLSSSSGASLPLSPQLQYKHTHNRSTSQLSDMSTNGNRMARSAFNFSRPISRASARPSMESPSRLSMESHTRVYSEEGVRPSMETTASTEHELEDKTDEQGGSYVYAKYSLPRGRMVDRESLPLEAMMPKIDFDNPRSPPAVASPSAARPQQRHLDDEPIRMSTESLPVRPPPIPELGHQHRHSMTSMNTSNTSNSASTIKASKHNPSTSADGSMTAEAHLEKGIACHERGSLKESTYHLRLAAKANNPTAMLLYALACRHGWGMRVSPAEGVAWLRKAIDMANVAMNESENADGAPPAIQRTQRAQFALGVYELGVSHMNGWGAENDKVLALRCFEIAAAWGDADAMAEAGFCYYQGVGCKKDLRKAATYYRQAEAKGISMVGNSWIHKSKYDAKPDAGEDERSGRTSRAGADDKSKKRDKSRTRTLFSRKKSDR